VSAVDRAAGQGQRVGRNIHGVLDRRPARPSRMRSAPPPGVRLRREGSTPSPSSVCGLCGRCRKQLSEGRRPDRVRLETRSAREPGVDGRGSISASQALQAAVDASAGTRTVRKMPGTRQSNPVKPSLRKLVAASETRFRTTPDGSSASNNILARLVRRPRTPRVIVSPDIFATTHPLLVRVVTHLGGVDRRPGGRMGNRYAAAFKTVT